MRAHFFIFVLFREGRGDSPNRLPLSNSARCGRKEKVRTGRSKGGSSRVIEMFCALVTATRSCPMSHVVLSAYYSPSGVVIDLEMWIVSRDERKPAGNRLFIFFFLEKEKMEGIIGEVRGRVFVSQ